MRYFQGRKVFYEGKNFIVTLVKAGNMGEPLFFGCTDFSVTDPWIMKQRHMYENCTELALIFKCDDPTIKRPELMSHRERKILYKNPDYFGCEGLRSSAKEFAGLINSIKNNGVVVQFQMKSGLMICTDDFSENLEKLDVCLFALSVPFKGTKTVEPDEVGKALNSFQKEKMYDPMYSSHIIDYEISRAKAPELVGKSLEKVTIISSGLRSAYEYNSYIWPSKMEVLNPIHLAFKYVGSKLEKAEHTKKGSNGAVTIESQEGWMEMRKNPKAYYRIYEDALGTFTNRHVREIVQKEINKF